MSTITNVPTDTEATDQEVTMSTITTDPTVLDRDPLDGFDFAVGSITAPQLRQWASDQFHFGRLFAAEKASPPKARLTKANYLQAAAEAAVSPQGDSKPFIAGFLVAMVEYTNSAKSGTALHRYRQAVVDAAPEYPDMPLTPEEAAAQAVAQHCAKIDAAKQAQGLIEQSAKASMKPVGVDHYSASELDEAMATVERYGRWNEDGGFTVGYERTLAGEAQAYAQSAAHRHPLQQEQAYWLVKKRLFEYAADAQLRMAKVAIFAERLLGQGEWAPAGTEELIFVSMPTNTKAYAQRGEAVWVLHYQPVTFTGRDGTLRSAFQVGEKSPTYESGVLGVAATFPSLHAAREAASDLRRALNTIARHSELASQFREDGHEVAEHVAPDLDADPVV